MKPENKIRLKDFLIAAFMTLIFIFLNAFGYSEFMSAILTMNIIIILDKVYQKLEAYRKL